jgi:Uma2 family endonuclease
MASEPSSTLTFTELEAMLEANPDEYRRHELIDGVLYVTPAPIPRHQRVLDLLNRALARYEDAHGGLLLPGAGVYHDERNYVIPDTLYFRAGNLGEVSERRITGPPDLVVEVSSDSTRRRDLTVKRRYYERTGVGEYWFVDLRTDTVLVHRHDPGFDRPLAIGMDGTITSPLLPGLAVPVARILAPFPKA